MPNLTTPARRAQDLIRQLSSPAPSAAVCRWAGPAGDGTERGQHTVRRNVVAARGDDSVRRLQVMPARASRLARGRWCWSSPRSSACTNTSLTSRAPCSAVGFRDRARAVRSARAMRSRTARSPSLVEEVILAKPDAQVMADPDACVAWPPRTAATSRAWGITGFCWGGQHHLAHDAHNLAVKAGVAWYGRLVGATSALQPRHCGRRRAAERPGAGLYGGADTGIPLDTVDKMKALRSAARRQALRVRRSSRRARRLHADYRPSQCSEDAGCATAGGAARLVQGPSAWRRPGAGRGRLPMTLLAIVVRRRCSAACSRCSRPA